MVKVSTMDKYQPLRDTIGLMAGAKVRRTQRPGEQFDLPEKPRHSRIRSLITIVLTGIMLSFRPM